jgi:type IV pilus assembly protein PilC
MKVFNYQGRKLGVATQGVIEAKNKRQARKLLQKQHIWLHKITPVDTTAKPLFKKQFGRKVTDKDIFLLTKKLATMTTASMPLFESFKLAQEQLKQGHLKEIGQQILDDLEAGHRFSEALAKHKTFNSTYLNMVKAGELTGSLDVFLSKLTKNLEKNIQLKNNIKKALFYPIVLIVVAILTTTFMLFQIVPTFEKMYQSMKIELPAMTQSIVDLRHFMSEPFNLMVAIVSIFFIMMVYQQSQKVKKIKKFKDRIVFKIPLFGKIIHQSIMAKTALLMADLVSTKVGIIEILETVIKVSNNVIFVNAIDNIKHNVLMGQSLSDSFAQESIFPSNFAQLIKVGEKTGKVEEMLKAISTYYQEEFDTLVQGLAMIIEPIMIVIVGGLIGFLLIALYLPIFSVGNLIGG